MSVKDCKKSCGLVKIRNYHMCILRSNKAGYLPTTHSQFLWRLTVCKNWLLKWASYTRKRLFREYRTPNVFPTASSKHDRHVRNSPQQLASYLLTHSLKTNAADGSGGTPWTGRLPLATNWPPCRPSSPARPWRRTPSLSLPPQPSRDRSAWRSPASPGRLPWQRRVGYSTDESAVYSHSLKS